MGAVNDHMGYLAVWKVLENMVTDFRKRGVAVPVKVLNDLRNAKTSIKILEADPNQGDSAQKIEGYLGNVESYLVSEGQKRFGWEYVDEWFKPPDEAGRKILEEEEKETMSIPRMPRKQRWIRVTSSDELPLGKLRTFAEESNLSYNVQKDGCLLVYGEDESIKNFVKKISAKYALKAESSAKKVRNRQSSPAMN